jgi:hypothetical protein
MSLLSAGRTRNFSLGFLPLLPRDVGLWVACALVQRRVRLIPCVSVKMQKPEANN